MSEGSKRLIVGLGNPGKRYALTRHNLGQILLYAFANIYHFSFKKERALQGELAQGISEDKTLFLLFPLTYMNLSGEAVRKVMHFYKIERDNLLVLVDDADLPFGALRFRDKGRCGGHNGLRSIESHLGSPHYQRLKMGIGRPDEAPLEHYVLSPFTKDEQKQLPEITDRGVTCLTDWLSGKHEGIQ